MLVRTLLHRSPEPAQLAHMQLLRGLLPAACPRHKAACDCPSPRRRSRRCRLQLLHTMRPALQGCLLMLLLHRLLLLLLLLLLGMPRLQPPLLQCSFLQRRVPPALQQCFLLPLVCIVECLRLLIQAHVTMLMS